MVVSLKRTWTIKENIADCFVWKWHWHNMWWRYRVLGGLLSIFNCSAEILSLNSSMYWGFAGKLYRLKQELEKPIHKHYFLLLYRILKSICWSCLFFQLICWISTINVCLLLIAWTFWRKESPTYFKKINWIPPWYKYTFNINILPLPLNVRL